MEKRVARDLEQSRKRYPLSFWIYAGSAVILGLVFGLAIVSGGLSVDPVFAIAQTVFKAIAEYINPLIPMFVIAGVALVCAVGAGIMAYYLAQYSKAAPTIPDQPSETVGQNLSQAPAEWVDFNLANYTKEHTNTTDPVKGLRVRIKSEQTDATIYQRKYPTGSEFRAEGWGIYGDDPTPYIGLKPARGDLTIHVPVSECQFDKNHDPDNTQWTPTAEEIMFGTTKSSELTVSPSPLLQTVPEGNPLVVPTQINPQDDYPSPTNGTGN